MQFAKNNCNRCACEKVCSVKNDVEAFRSDLMNLEWYGGTKYINRLDMLSVRVECSNYIDKAKLGDAE